MYTPNMYTYDKIEVGVVVFHLLKLGLKAKNVFP